jgi:ADP-heptose:LPS heptosyltransferase
MKILIVKLGALGDVINTFPLVVILKEKLQCEIHWLVAPLSYPMVADHDCVDRAILFDKTKGLSSVKEVLKQIRVQEPYDIAFDLQRILKSGFFVLASKSRRKIGFDKNRCKELSWFFPFERIPPWIPKVICWINIWNLPTTFRSNTIIFNGRFHKKIFPCQFFQNII